MDAPHAGPAGPAAPGAPPLAGASLVRSPLLVVGGGNMARAILHGASAAGAIDPALCVVVEPDAAKHGAFRSAHSGHDSAWREFTALEASRGPGVVLLAVKPQSLATVGAQISAALAGGPERAVLSILAGAPCARVAAAMGRGRVVRVMPNTPAQVGRGMTAIAPSPAARAEDVALTRTLFAAVGEVIVIDEGLMDAFTAVAGSGPAYVFYLAEAMRRAAVDLGFAPDVAATMVRQTVAGSGELLARSRDSFDALRAAVTSKGGTTEAACGVLDRADLFAIFQAALRAARDRGAELARG